MDERLSVETQRYLTSVVSAGLYPSEQAALEAAVALLREKTEGTPLVPNEHMEAVEQALASSQAGRSRPLTERDWSRLQDIARNAGPGQATNDS